ncbi:MAG: TonB-dependent hemoglobin/transferrin/lactoferrin family receptor [Comamonas sp.]|nr:TonB-dependent hemoglobin/transferrin/lactoferrin family receptor [Comamonas sp.]
MYPQAACPAVSTPLLRLRPVALLIALLGISSHALAEQHTLPTVLISGARFEQAHDDLPLSADVVSEEGLRNQQSRTLRQALQDLPNTSVRSSPARLALSASSAAYARDGNTGIHIRGLGGNRVLMTVDGIRMPRSYVSRSAMFDREYLSLELFKGIELLRGPASALYGGDGMAGVVNFITHNPSDFLQDGKTLGGRVAAGWSQEDHSYSLTGTVAGQASDTVQWMLTATGRKGHEVINRGDNRAANNQRTRPDPLDADDNALLAKLVFTPDGRQRHSLTLEHSQKKQDINQLSSRASKPTDRPNVVDEYTSSDIQRQRLASDGRWRLDSAWAQQLRLYASYQQAESRRVGHSFLLDGTHRIRDNQYEENTWQIGAQAETVLRQGDWSHRLSYGIDHVRNNISNLYDGQAPLPPETFPLKRFPDTRETTTGVYVQAESVLGKWSITPGLRIDHFDIHAKNQNLYHPPAPQPAKDLSGTAFLPKLGLLYRATDEWSVFGQYSTGYRPPEAGQVNDRFQAQAALPGVGIVDNYIIANPDLRPERSRGLELGLRQRRERLSLDAVAFYNRYSNLIEDARLIERTPTKQVFQTVNISKAKIYGFELKGIYDWGQVLDGKLRSSFAYGYTKGKDLGNSAPLNSISPSQLSLGLRYDRAQWGVYADARYYSRKKKSTIDLVSIGNNKADTTQFATPAATTLDIGGQWRPRKNLRLNLAVHNVTNRKYWQWSDVYGVAADSSAVDAYSQPGRNVRLSLVVDF